MKSRRQTRGRKPGRKRPADAEIWIGQVQQEFAKQKAKLGAKKAAEELGVGLASFYNYLNGVTLPDMEVLRRANDRWGITLKYIDFSEILPKGKMRSPKQLVFGFLEMLRADDVKVVQVGPKTHSILQVTFNIRFSA